MSKPFDRADAWWPTHHSIFEDERYQRIAADPLRYWTWSRMCHDADRAWPSRPALPRWAKQAVLDDLAEVGLIELLPNDTYAIPRLADLRASAVRAGLASAAGAVRDASGHFARRETPTALDQRPPTALDQQRTNGAPTTETETETEKENVGERTLSPSSTASTSDEDDDLDEEPSKKRPKAAPDPGEGRARVKPWGDLSDLPF